MSSPVSISNSASLTGNNGMETVVAVALGALAAVFLGALLVLLVICRRQRCYYVSCFVCSAYLSEREKEIVEEL